MNKIFNLMIIFTLITFLQSNELEIGSKIPLFAVKMDQVNGNPISLKDAMGKNGLIVIFSCNGSKSLANKGDKLRESGIHKQAIEYYNYFTKKGVRIDIINI